MDRLTAGHCSPWAAGRIECGTSAAVRMTIPVADWDSRHPFPSDGRGFELKKYKNKIAATVVRRYGRLPQDLELQDYLELT